MVVELATILDSISQIPPMINSLKAIASQLKLGAFGSGDVRKLQEDLENTRNKLREIGSIGLCI